jgi:hypothetical protein
MFCQTFINSLFLPSDLLAFVLFLQPFGEGRKVLFKGRSVKVSGSTQNVHRVFPRQTTSFAQPRSAINPQLLQWQWIETPGVISPDDSTGFF